MERTLRFVLLLVASFVLAVAAASVVNGKPEYTKKEKTPCTTCHVKAGSKDLNDVGKCYAEKHTLDGCRTPK
jgi:cytochrome c553